MNETRHAADLPECSIVVNDLAGKVFYAQHAPSYEPRWVAASAGPDVPSSCVDYEIKHGARVIRIGDWPAPSEMWPDARDRLARHLYVEGSPADWRGTAELAWDREDERINRERWLARADEILAVISGKES